MTVREAELELPRACSSAFVLDLPAFLPPSFSLSGPYPYLWAAHGQVRTQRNLKSPASLSHATMRYSTDSFLYCPESFPELLRDANLIVVTLWYTVVIMFCGEIHLGLMLALFVALINLTGSATACQMPPLPTSWRHTHPVRLPFTHTSHNDIFKDYSNAWYSVQKVICLWFAPFQLLLFRFPDENYTEAFNCVLKILINHSVSISHILQVWDNHSHCVTVSHFNSFICYIRFYVEFLNS